MIKHLPQFLAKILVALMCVCQLSCSRQSDATNKRDIVVAAAIGAYAGPFYIASEKGFWKAEGLDVTGKYFTSGRLCLDALLAGSADIIAVAETPMMFAGLSGQNEVAVATILYAHDLKIVARRDHGISKPEDLRGKKVAMLLGSTSEYYAGLFLGAYGMGFSEINRVNLNPADMPLALVKGDIDAYVIWEPFAYGGYEKLGEGKAVRFLKRDVYTVFYNMAVRKDFAEQHPDVIQRALRAVIRSNEFINGHREEAISIIARKAGMGQDALKSIWGDYEFKVELSPELLGALKNEAQWAKTTKIVKPETAIPDYRLFVDPRPLRAVDPSKTKIE